ncbi:MAG: ComF family protein [Gammaproteobacteria bacterium]
MVNNWIDIIQDCLFPPTCILCGNSGSNSRDICSCCYEQLPRIGGCCGRCAEPLDAPGSEQNLCGRCLRQEPAFDKVFTPFLYQGAVSHLITSLKFGACHPNARLLGLLLAEYLRREAEMPDCIMPVPLHKARYRQRGFNQALEIARTVSKELAVPLDYASCIRHRDTPHQTGLAAKQRRKNMKNAFAPVKPLYARHIALLDDVMTTGSTVQELAGVLKQAGATRVDVWVCARA